VVSSRGRRRGAEDWGDIRLRQKPVENAHSGVKEGKTRKRRHRQPGSEGWAEAGEGKT